MSVKNNNLMKPEPHNFYCVWLIKGTKDAPAHPYKNKENCYKYIPDVKSYNYGVLTGEVNNITVVDIDSYKFTEDSQFIKEFPDYLNEFQTYAVSSPSGGHHFYYKYDPEISQVASLIHHVDIRSNGGYIVGAGSQIGSSKYKVFKDEEISEMPKVLKEWILNNLYPNKKDKKDKKDIDKDYKEFENVEMQEEEKKDIVNHIKRKLNTISKATTKFFKTYDEYLYFTSAMKYLEQQKLWDEFSKTQDGYDKSGNLKIWGLTTKNMVPWLLKKLEFTAYDFYKPTLPNTYEPDIIINQNKLSVDLYKTNIKNIKHIHKEENDNIDNGKIIIDYEINDSRLVNNYIVKSDTGTGKTHSFGELIKKLKLPFISIVSRVSLGRDQYERFNKDGIKCQFYQYEDFTLGQSYIVTIDSIFKLGSLRRLDKYIIFLDEFNSIIEYLLSAETLGKLRVSIFPKLEELIYNCGGFIASDADISDISIKFLEYNDIKFKYIENKYKHNKNVKAEELFSEKELYQELEQNKKWILCCDSKKEAQLIYSKLQDDKILLIVSGVNEYYNFDDYDRIIYSPKIIYGVDSTMHRNVYTYYKECTISPKMMMQQICRCRNIKTLKFLFTKKSYNPNLKTLNELKCELSKKNKYANLQFKFHAEKEVYDRYFKLLTLYEYQQICYNTNKFGHFLNILKIRGFDYDDNRRHTIIEQKEKKKELKLLMDELIENFDEDNENNIRINELLKLPKEEMKNYAEYFISPYKLKQHFLICSFLYKSEIDIKNILIDKKEFNIKKITDSINKVNFLKKLKKQVNDNNLYNICSKPDENTKYDDLSKEYEIIFGKKELFTTANKIDKIQYTIYKSLFGECVEKEREGYKKDGSKRKYIYSFKDCSFDKDEKLYKFREKINMKQRIIKPEIVKDHKKIIEYVDKFDY
jgi:hypothetical protein